MLNVESISVRSNGPVLAPSLIERQTVRTEAQRPVHQGATIVKSYPILPGDRRPSVANGAGVPRGSDSQRTPYFSRRAEWVQRAQLRAGGTCVGWSGRQASRLWRRIATVYPRGASRGMRQVRCRVWFGRLSGCS